jgi:hypothetical protein
MKPRTYDETKIQIFCAALQGILAATPTGDHAPEAQVALALKFANAALEALGAEDQC